MNERPLKVGLMLPTVEGWFGGKTARWADLLALARLAEDVGFDSLCMPDHLLFKFGGTQTEETRYAHEYGGERGDEAPKGLWEVWSVLAALAASTRRIELGPLVSSTTFRNPALLARIADTVDEISGGRVVLGLGAGYHEYEYRAFGYPHDHLVTRFEEALHVIHTLLRQGWIDFTGHYYQARECELRPRGPRVSGPPILIGALAHAPRMLRLVARYADLWNAWSVNSVQAIPPLRDAVDAACHAIGRDPATLGRTVALLVDLPSHAPTAGWLAHFRSAFAPPASGSTAELTEQLRAYAAEGIAHVQVLLEPSTAAGVEAFAPVLEHLSRTQSHVLPMTSGTNAVSA
jgi:alkanesulfonate monooxygenase SsuD/methylene tetrahydromethanopterin reductase-like flavin-dependent oxidoreductase (luciferase family)